MSLETSFERKNRWKINRVVVEVFCVAEVEDDDMNGPPFAIRIVA